LHLTREEERVYDGEEGWARSAAMRILVKLGDLYGAERLIPIEWAHISGVSYKTGGDALIEFLEELVEAGGRVSTHTTLNPSSFDPAMPWCVNIPDRALQRQMHIIQLYQALGVEATLTCTPYYVEAPTPNSHLAWAESSAVVYANSIIGAWTNREGGPSALASAIIGKTPDHGMHRPENREPGVLVEVQTALMSEVEYGALGSYVGRLVGDKIPLFMNLGSPTEVQLRQLGAALASTGMVSMFRWGEEPKRGCMERIQVDGEAIKDAVENLSTTMEEPDLIYIGCPHCSPEEIREISELLRGRRVNPNRRLWICTSQYVKDEMRGCVAEIERAGGRVIAGTCAVVSWLRETGVDVVLTNSAKAMHYLPTLGGVEVTAGSLRECIEAACN